MTSLSLVYAGHRSLQFVSTECYIIPPVYERVFLSEFSLNLLWLDQRRISCIVSWSVDAPNLGTISETVVSSANFHMEERVLLIVRSLIITKKSHGPIRVPCGIPAGTGLESEKQSELSLTR